ncbi:MAG: hypothetical protein VW715_02315 [Rhodospirillales bacterium]
MDADQEEYSAQEYVGEILIALQAADQMSRRFKKSMAILNDLSIKALEDVDWKGGEAPVEVIIFPQ